jgi:hypothetical protein
MLKRSSTSREGTFPSRIRWRFRRMMPDVPQRHRIETAWRRRAVSRTPRQKHINDPIGLLTASARTAATSSIRRRYHRSIALL